MTVESYQLQPQEIAGSIRVTPAAKGHFQKQLEKTKKSAVRISLKESGCSGYMYVIEEVVQPNPGDVPAPGTEVPLLVAPENIAMLKGLEIDYVKNGLNYNLVLNNPNSKNACGCGESFSF